MHTLNQIFGLVELSNKDKETIKNLLSVLKMIPRREGGIYGGDSTFKTELNHFIGSIDQSLESSKKIEQVIQFLLEKKGENQGVTEYWGDGNVYDHSKAQYRIVRDFGNLDLNNGNINNEEYESLYILAMIHDLGELMVGDVIFDEKKDTSIDKKTLEYQWGIEILRMIIKDNEQLEKLENILAIDFYKEQNEKLHNLFKLYEKLSYLNGAIKAFENRDNLEFSAKMIHNVLYNNIYDLCVKAEYLPGIKKFLIDYKEIIDELFNFVFRKEDELRIEDTNYFTNTYESFSKAYTQRQKFKSENEL